MPRLPTPYGQTNTRTYDRTQANRGLLLSLRRTTRESVNQGAASAAVVEASRHTGFLVIGVVAVQHPDAGIIGAQHNAGFCKGNTIAVSLLRPKAAVGCDDLERVPMQVHGGTPRRRRSR